MPVLDSFANLSERASRSLPSRNLINEEEIRALCQGACDERLRYLEAESKQAIERWTMGAARKKLVRSLPTEPVRRLPEGAPAWAEAALSEGRSLERAVIPAGLAEDLGHVLDWLVAEPQRQLSKLNWDQAVAKTRAWDASLQKKSLTQEDPDGISPLCDAGSMGFGWRWVEVKSKASLAREGALMRHCVGTYAPQVEQGKCRIVSLRDANNKPRLTVELGVSGERSKESSIELELLQIRGACNRPPEPSEAEALRELTMALCQSGAKITGGKELSSSGGLWQEKEQRLALLCELPEGASHPEAVITLGARSGKLAAGLTFGSVIIEAVPEAGLPKRLTATSVRVNGEGDYDLRGWSGKRLAVEDRVLFSSLRADGFEIVMVGGEPARSTLSEKGWRSGAYGYGKRARELLEISNADVIRVFDERFKRMELSSGSGKNETTLTRVAAERLSVRAGLGEGLGEGNVEAATALVVLDCSFGSLNVSSLGGRFTQAAFETTSAQSAHFEGADLWATHLKCDYEAFDEGAASHWALGGSGAKSVRNEGLFSVTTSETTFKSGFGSSLSEMLNEMEHFERASGSVSSPVKAFDEVIHLIGQKKVASAARFYAEIGMECPTVFIGRGATSGVAVDYAAIVEAAEGLANEATQTARAAQRAWRQPMSEWSEELTARIVKHEPFEQLPALGARGLEASVALSVSEALADLCELPESLKKLGVKTRSFVDEDGKLRKAPLSFLAGKRLDAMMWINEEDKLMPGEISVRESYEKAFRSHDPGGGPVALVTLNSEQLADACELMRRSGSEGDESLARWFVESLLIESRSAADPPSREAKELMEARVGRDVRAPAPKPASLEFIKASLTSVGAACHVLGWLSGEPQLAREALAEWLGTVSNEPHSGIVRDPLRIRETAEKLLPDVAFSSDPAETLSEAVKVCELRGNVQAWGKEFLDGVCAESTAAERQLFALALSEKMSRLNSFPDGAFKKLLERSIAAGLTAPDQAGALAAPSSLAKLSENKSALIAIRWGAEHGAASAKWFAQMIHSDENQEISQEEALERKKKIDFFCEAALLYNEESKESGEAFTKALTQTLLKEKLLPASFFENDPESQNVSLSFAARLSLCQEMSKDRDGLAACSPKLTARSQKNLIANLGEPFWVEPLDKVDARPAPGQ